MYAGQIVEIGTVEEIFIILNTLTLGLYFHQCLNYQKRTELYTIHGTPPSLYNEVKGDAFAPRNPYAMKIDFVEEPPFFKVSETHYAKTWLLDPRAPKVEPPKAIQNLHKKLSSKLGVNDR